jgi:arsenical pump membrane protein
MFIIVEALVETGWIAELSHAFQGLFSNLLIAILSITFLSALTCNLMNNQPMTILFTQILLYNSFSLNESMKLGVVFSLIMGSNFGANFTLLGALAGIMWHKIISDKDVNISYGKFAKFGFLIMPVVILLSCLALLAEIVIVFQN